MIERKLFQPQPIIDIARYAVAPSAAVSTREYDGDATPVSKRVFRTLHEFYDSIGVDPAIAAQIIHSSRERKRQRRLNANS